MTRSSVILGWSAHPTTRRLYRSRTTDRYIQPSFVLRYVMSDVHTRLGPAGAKSRLTTLPDHRSFGLMIVVRRNCRLRLAAIPCLRIRRATRWRPQVKPCSRSSRTREGCRSVYDYDCGLPQYGSISECSRIPEHSE